MHDIDWCADVSVEVEEFPEDNIHHGHRALCPCTQTLSGHEAPPNTSGRRLADIYIMICIDYFSNSVNTSGRRLAEVYKMICNNYFTKSPNTSGRCLADVYKTWAYCNPAWQLRLLCVQACALQKHDDQREHCVAAETVQQSRTVHPLERGTCSRETRSAQSSTGLRKQVDI